MGVLLNDAFTPFFGFLFLGWLLLAYGLSALALYKALKNYNFWIVLILSLLVLLPALFQTRHLLSLGRVGFLAWLILDAAPLFMSVAALVRLFTGPALRR